MATYYRICDNMCGPPLLFFWDEEAQKRERGSDLPKIPSLIVEVAGTSTRWLVRCYVPQREREHLGQIRVGFSRVTRGPEADTGWCWVTGQGPVTLWLFLQGCLRMVAAGKQLCAGEGKDSEATWLELYCRNCVTWSGSIISSAGCITALS